MISLDTLNEVSSNDLSNSLTNCLATDSKRLSNGDRFTMKAFYDLNHDVIAGAHVVHTAHMAHAVHASQARDSAHADQVAQADQIARIAESRPFTRRMLYHSRHLNG